MNEVTESLETTRKRLDFGGKACTAKDGDGCFT